MPKRECCALQTNYRQIEIYEKDSTCYFASQGQGNSGESHYEPVTQLASLRRILTPPRACYSSSRGEVPKLDRSRVPK